MPIAAETSRRKRSAAWLSVAANVGAAVLKLGAAVLTGSSAVLSEAAHSFADLTASVIALVSVRARRPAGRPGPPVRPREDRARLGRHRGRDDPGHGGCRRGARDHAPRRPDRALRLGHRRAARDGGRQHRRGPARAQGRRATRTRPRSRPTPRTSRPTSSPRWAPPARWCRSTLTGIEELDAIAACVIAVLVARTGVELVISGTRVLVDVAIPEREVQIVHEVLDGTAEIRGWHRLRARRAGATRHIDLHLLVDPSMSVARAHEITDEIEAALEAAAGRRRRGHPHRAGHQRARGGRGAAVNHGRGSADEGPSRPFQGASVRRLVLSLVALLLPRADGRRLRLGDERLPGQGCRRPAEVLDADDRPDDEGHDRRSAPNPAAASASLTQLATVVSQFAERRRRREAAGRQGAARRPAGRRLPHAGEGLARPEGGARHQGHGGADKALEEFNKATADESAAVDAFNAAE